MKSAETAVNKRAGKLGSRFEGKVVTDEEKFAKRLTAAVEKAEDQDEKLMTKSSRD